MKTGIIYKITFPSKKIYIGKTSQKLSNRRIKHYNDAFNINSSVYNTKLSRAIRKYGKNNLIWDTLYTDIKESKLNGLEIKLIKKHNTYKNGYNSTLGGEGISGFQHTEKTKSKISKSNSGSNNGQYGKSPSLSTRKRLSDASKKSWAKNKDKLSSTRLRGENHPNSKLNWKKVKEIRLKYIPYKYSCYKLAKEYDIHFSVIHDIVKNKIWKE